MLREIDFSIEATNMKVCRAFFEGNESIYVPKVFDSLCSKRMCVMEFIHGVKANDVEQLRKDGIDTKEVARLCVQAFASMIFHAPFLHVDPHAGNLFVRKQANGKPQLVLLDHGMYNYFEKGFNEFIQELWLAMVAQDQRRVNELCSVYQLERFSQLISLSMTGRSMTSHNKFGEEMGGELHDSIEDRMKHAMQTVTMDIFEKRLGIVRVFSRV